MSSTAIRVFTCGVLALVAVCLVACGGGSNGGGENTISRINDADQSSTNGTSDDARPTFNPPMPTAEEMKAADFDKAKYEGEKAKADERVLTFLLEFIDKNPDLKLKTVDYVRSVPDEWKDIAVEKSEGYWDVYGAVPVSYVDTDRLRQTKMEYTKGLGIVECKVIFRMSEYPAIKTKDDGNCRRIYVLWDIDKGEFRTKGLVAE